MPGFGFAGTLGLALGFASVLTAHFHHSLLGLLFWLIAG